jgi:hypothetical protein
LTMSALRSSIALQLRGGHKDARMFSAVDLTWVAIMLE